MITVIWGTSSFGFEPGPFEFLSAQEAVYRLLSLPLSRSSREIVFVPTDMPDNRTKLFKPMKLIEQLEDDDTDVFAVRTSYIQ